MGRLGEAHESIRGSWSELQERWAGARQQWRDVVGQRFEREWWQQLEETMPRLLEALADVEEVLERSLWETEE
jgi:uncharacterized protein YukE